MNGTYPVSVYTWNHYDGEEPEVNSIGLPLEYAGASLPTSIPVHADTSVSDVSENEQLSYSPGLMEMPHAPQTAPVQKAVEQTGNPKQPGLWKAIGNAVYGGGVQVNTTNSTAAVASGQNQKLSSGS